MSINTREIATLGVGFGARSIATMGLIGVVGRILGSITQLVSKASDLVLAKKNGQDITQYVKGIDSVVVSKRSDRVSSVSSKNTRV